MSKKLKLNDKRKELLSVLKKYYSCKSSEKNKGDKENELN